MPSFKNEADAKEIEPAGSIVVKEDGIYVHDGKTVGGVKIQYKKDAFIEELIQLQVKYGIVLEGYDVSFWGPYEAYFASSSHNNPDFLVTEKKIRDRWEQYKGD